MISRLNSSRCWRELNLNGRDFRLEGSRRHLSDKLLINISVTERQSTTRTLLRMCSALEVDLTDLGIVTGKLREKSEKLWMKVVMICKSEKCIAWLKLFSINPSIDTSRKIISCSLNFHFPVGASFVLAQFLHSVAQNSNFPRQPQNLKIPSTKIVMFKITASNR